MRSYEYDLSGLDGGRGGGKVRLACRKVLEKADPGNLAQADFRTVSEFLSEGDPPRYFAEQIPIRS